MFQANSENQDQLVELLEKSIQQGATFSAGMQDAPHFEHVVMKHMADAWVARPWMMCLFMFFFRAILHFQERRLEAFSKIPSAALERQNELVQKLCFAAHYGRLANASQRAWCFIEIKRYGISHFDAPFMVWSGTLHVKTQQIRFGHWDWISGFFIMTPLYFLVLLTICTCMCGCLSPAAKAFSATVYLAEIVFLFKFYKSQSFDVYKIGSKYFKANGWGFTPLPR